MELKDFITAGATLFSIALSATAIYLSQFRRPKIVVGIGPEIHLYYDVNGGTGVYLPVLFQNRSPTRGIISKAYLVIKDPTGAYFGMRWLESATIAWPKIEYAHTGRARPFKVDGYDSVVDAFWFFHPRSNVLSSLELLSGEYEVTLHGWTKDKAEPDVGVTERFVIDLESAKILNENLAGKVTTTRYFYFKDRGLISFVSGNAKPRFSDQRTD